MKFAVKWITITIDRRMLTMALSQAELYSRCLYSCTGAAVARGEVLRGCNGSYFAKLYLSSSSLVYLLLMLVENAI